MDRLSPLLERVYRQKIITPTIVEAHAGFLECVRDEIKEYLPFNELRKRYGVGLMDRFFELGSIALSSFKQIRLFNMISAPLTGNLIEEIAQWRGVRKMYPDTTMYALQPLLDEGKYHDKRTRKNFTTTYWTKKMLGLDRARELGYDGSGVVATVIDTGVIPSHQQLRRVTPKTAMMEKGGTGRDSNGHGSWCTSCLGGISSTNRFLNVPVEGMATKCRLISIQALGMLVGVGLTSDIIEATEMAIDMGSDIVSMSLGSTECAGDVPEDNVEAVAINKLVENNIIPVVAAGNAGKPESIGSPGCAPNALTVGAIDPFTNKIAPYSSRGKTKWGIKPDVVAPGSFILSACAGLLDTLTNKKPMRYAALSGTSMATPGTAGVLTCARQLYAKNGITLTVDMTKDAMSKYGQRTKDNTYGWGLLTWDIMERYLVDQLGGEV